MRKITFLPCLALAVFLLTSCLGVSMDITMRANGSGRIVLEYRVSQMLEAMGRLDGNERWPAIPVGRADMERSVARVPGLRLSSFSARNLPNGMGGSDLVTRVALDFRDTDALLAFLDITGARASFGQQGGRSFLRLVLLDPSPPIDSAELLALIKEVSAGYEIRISINVPRRNTNLAAVSLPAAPQHRPGAPGFLKLNDGRTASFSLDTGDIPAITEGLVLEFSW